MIERNISEICDGLLDDAVMMWERDGGIVPTVFALGHSRSLFACPYTDEGCKVDETTRVRIHALLASTVGAVFIGRIDETFYAERMIDDGTLRRADLGKLAKTDPTVRTAIVVQATDVKTEQSVVHIAVAGLDDEGEMEWDYGALNDAEGQLIDECRAVVALSHVLTVPLTDQQLTDEINQLGWFLSDSDKMNNDHDEDE